MADKAAGGSIESGSLEGEFMMTQRAADHGRSDPSGAPVNILRRPLERRAHGRARSQEAEAPSITQKAHLTEAPTTRRSRLRAGKGPESPPRRAAGAVVLIVLVLQKPARQAMRAAPTRTADIRRRQRAVQIGPHMSRGPAGQLPTRLSHHASQEALKPGLCFSARACPGA